MLWELFKHLRNKAPIYKDFMDEQENKIPQTYVILETDVFDEGRSSGDGINILRTSSYNVRIHSRSVSKAKMIMKEYRETLILKGLQFSQYGPTYDPSTNYFSILITGDYIYGAERPAILEALCWVGDCTRTDYGELAATLCWTDIIEI